MGRIFRVRDEMLAVGRNLPVDRAGRCVVRLAYLPVYQYDGSHVRKT